MSQYHQDLLVLMTWAVSTLGALFVGLAVWGGRKVLARLDSIEEMLASEVKAINSMLHQHEIRLVKIESSCLHFHGAAAGQGHHPRRQGDEVQRVAFPDYPD